LGEVQAGACLLFAALIVVITNALWDTGSDVGTKYITRAAIGTGCAARRARFKAVTKLNIAEDQTNQILGADFSVNTALIVELDLLGSFANTFITNQIGSRIAQSLTLGIQATRLTRLDNLNAKRLSLS
jgi:hypothetical protein